MRLNKGQKERLVAWIAQGLKTDEINRLGQACDQPFTVSRQQVDNYRKSRRVELQTIQRAGEMEALTQGLALKEVRVQKLQQLAALMERDLFGGMLWLEQAKGVGSGDIAEIFEYEEFNKGEVDAYRGVLEDIAKEVGGRVQKQEISGKDGADLVVKVLRGVSVDEL